MPGILVSYRREDSAAYAGRLADRLRQHFGRDNVFIDIDTIRPGQDFADVIEKSVSSCDALVAVIGKAWATSTDALGRRRLDREDDFTRMEIATALDREIPVIPTLVGGATMPAPNELPNSLSKLTRRQALEISDIRFHEDVDRLIEALSDAPVPSLTAQAPPRPAPAGDVQRQSKPSPKWLWPGGAVAIILLVTIGALIQYQPWKAVSGASGAVDISGNQFLGSAIVGNVSVVVNEAARAGTALDPALVELLKDAAGLSKAGEHDAAVAKIEEIRATSREVAALPSLLNNLGVEYLSAGKADQARKAFKDVLEKDPANRTAWAGLGELPDDRLKPLSVINFSSQWSSGSAAAANIVDGDPAYGWMSLDGNFPQSFILELPVECTLSELSFNNVPRGDANRAAKDIEISVSAQSETTGFEIAAKAVLAKGEIGQGVAVRPAKRGRWVKIRILSNHGNPDGTELGDVELIGRPLVR